MNGGINDMRTDLVFLPLILIIGVVLISFVNLPWYLNWIILLFTVGTLVYFIIKLYKGRM
jgi:hypothetical protein